MFYYFSTDADYPDADVPGVSSEEEPNHETSPAADRRIRSWQPPARVLFLLLWGLVITLLPRSVQAAPLTQGTANTSPQLYLIPQNAAETNVILEAHIVNLRLGLAASEGEEAGAPANVSQLVVDGTYGLHNPTDASVTQPLRLFPGGDRSLGAPQGVALTLDEAPVDLSPADDGGYTGAIDIPADSRITLRLRYQTGLNDSGLATMRYAPAILNQWAGNVSLRVDLHVPESIPAESWVELVPEGWRYGLVTADDITGLRWLYDFTIPETPMVLRFIAPVTWRELQAAQAAATDNAAVGEFIRLGRIYRTLLQAAPSETLQSRFYAQAVAAYNGGLESRGLALASPQERATLYSGLADLYRRRLVNAAPATRPTYARILVDAANATLENLPADSAQRMELQQWLVDGLRVLFNQARAQREWPTALAILEQMEELPDAVRDPAVIAENRRAILMHQGLQLMEQGNREAALAVAGEQIEAAELSPPQSTNLFNAWQISVTTTSEQMSLEATGLTSSDQLSEAVTALENVVSIWQEGVAEADNRAQESYRFELSTLDAVSPSPVTTTAELTSTGPLTQDETQDEMALQPGVRLFIDFPAGANGFLLARLLPPRADYALLQSLLSQLAPTSSTQEGLLWNQVSLRQPIDLADAVAEWESIAAGLEQQAASFESQSANTNIANSGESPEEAEAALRARIQAVNYRTVAQSWRQSVRQSWLHFTFRIDDPLYTRLNGQTPARSWYITAESPSQTFVFQSQVLNLSRVVILGLAVLLVLLTLAGLLWSLL